MKLFVSYIFCLLCVSPFSALAKEPLRSIEGILLGPFVGAVLGELSLQRTLNQASRAGFGTIIGLALSIAGKLVVGISMIGLFLIMRFTQP